MTDDKGRTSNPPPTETPPTLSYHAPAPRKRRPVAGALAILTALACLYLAFSFGAAAFASLVHRQWFPFAMFGVFTIGFFVACQTLVRTAVTLIRGRREHDDIGPG